MILYKLIITFDVMEGEAGAGQRYFAQNIAPLVNDRDGVYVGEIWWTLWGDIPKFLGGIVAEESLEALKELLRSEPWTKAIGEFRELVQNLEFRLVREEVQA